MTWHKSAILQTKVTIICFHQPFPIKTAQMKPHNEPDSESHFIGPHIIVGFYKP